MPASDAGNSARLSVEDRFLPAGPVLREVGQISEPQKAAGKVGGGIDRFRPRAEQLCLVVLRILQRADDGLGREAMAHSVAAGTLFAFFGDRTGAFAGIATVGLDLPWS
jgi:hypothetical protein